MDQTNQTLWTKADVTAILQVTGAVFGFNLAATIRIGNERI